MESIVNVCLSTNDKWAPFATVTIVSILSNTKSNVCVFVLYTDLSDNNIQKINSSISKFQNGCIKYVHIDSNKIQQFKLDIPYISNDTFSKFLFADLEQNIKKVIYTDIDVVFKADISELFDENLENNIIGAVEGISHVDGKDNDRLKIDQKHRYFQAGLLLIDCQKWRKNNIAARLFEISKKIPVRYGDQDLLNVMFANNYKKLHQKYCVIPFQLSKMKEFSSEARAALKNPFIIHYAGGDKPWITSCEFEKDFWQYASMTDFFVNILDIRLNNSFVSKERTIAEKCYTLFNVIPLLKIKRKFNYSLITERYYLFNFIPILKKTDDSSFIRWTSFFGIPILRLTKNRASKIFL